MKSKEGFFFKLILIIKKFYRIQKKLFFLFNCIIAIIILSTLLILFNKKKIRFAKLRRDVIGNSTSEFFLYLNKKKYENEFSDYFYFDDNLICNKHLNNVLKKKFSLFYFAKHCEFIAKNIKFFERYHLKMPTNWTKKNQLFNVNNYKVPNEFLFSDHQKSEGISFLDSIGYKDNKKIVTLVVRDNFYKDTLKQNKSWKYHEYRNALLASYDKSIKYLISQGYFVIKIGKGSNQELEINEKNYFDYSRSTLNSDFLDFWIISRSYFTITTGTGIDEVCAIYKVPILDTNFFPPGVIRSSQNFCLTIFKKIINKQNKLPLTLSQMLEYDKENKDIFKTFSYFQMKEFHDKFLLIDNTAEEILEAVKEMHKKLNNILIEKDPSIERQKKFWKLYRSTGLYDEHIKSKHINSSIGQKYIIENEWLIV